MALCSRVCSKNLRAVMGTQLFPYSICRSVSIVPQAAVKPPVESHDERNARLNRPQSPHLTIYKFQLTAMLSITHRFTGMALTAYVAGAGITSLLTPQPFTEVIQVLHNYPVLLFGVKALVAYPFAYHFCNGIRHLVWDSGNALTIKGVYTTGYAMLGASVLLTLFLLSL